MHSFSVAAEEFRRRCLVRESSCFVCCNFSFIRLRFLFRLSCLRDLLFRFCCTCSWFWAWVWIGFDGVGSFFAFSSGVRCFPRRCPRLGIGMIHLSSLFPFCFLAAKVGVSCCRLSFFVYLRVTGWWKMMF